MSPGQRPADGDQRAATGERRAVNGGRGRGRVIAVRHGETAWSRDGRHTSRTDVELTGPGRAAVGALARRLAGIPVAAVWSSPRRRALDTAHLAGFGDRVVVDDDLAEWDYGAAEGRTTLELREERPGWNVWDDAEPGSESPEDVAARCDRVIAAARAVDGDVLVFSHAHLLRVLAARWIGLEARCGRHFGLSTASVSVLGWQREDAVVELWNDTAHLDVAPRGDWDRTGSPPEGRATRG